MTTLKTDKGIVDTALLAMNQNRLHEVFAQGNFKLFYTYVCESYGIPASSMRNVDCPKRLLTAVLWSYLGGAEKYLGTMGKHFPPEQILAYRAAIRKVYEEHGILTSSIDHAPELTEGDRAFMSGFSYPVATTYPFSALATSTTSQPLKENTMKAFETINYVYGTNITNLTEADLIDAIKKAEGIKATLDDVKASSVKIKKMKEELDMAIGKMVEALDSK